MVTTNIGFLNAAGNDSGCSDSIDNYSLLSSFSQIMVPCNVINRICDLSSLGRRKIPFLVKAVLFSTVISAFVENANAVEDSGLSSHVEELWGSLGSSMCAIIFIELSFDSFKEENPRLKLHSYDAGKELISVAATSKLVKSSYVGNYQLLELISSQLGSKVNSILVNFLTRLRSVGLYGEESANIVSKIIRKGMPDVTYCPTISEFIVDAITTTTEVSITTSTLAPTTTSTLAPTTTSTLAAATMLILAPATTSTLASSTTVTFAPTTTSTLALSTIPQLLDDTAINTTSMFASNASIFSASDVSVSKYDFKYIMSLIPKETMLISFAVTIFIVALVFFFLGYRCSSTKKCRRGESICCESRKKTRCRRDDSLEFPWLAPLPARVDGGYVREVLGGERERDDLLV
ncbi:hypothetical protein [Candidatus Ichthyocystis hellenicum]|uniref:hypothetical protein n=1 Tax=Candidatus Ichthyocystis hellenicum TaxID=1561003 RepID=UPI000B81F529|nr:hypothetical protein [Candidatus Ichthyocystis hellenicum]